MLKYAPNRDVNLNKHIKCEMNPPSKHEVNAEEAVQEGLDKGVDMEWNDQIIAFIL